MDLNCLRNRYLNLLQEESTFPDVSVMKGINQSMKDEILKIHLKTKETYRKLKDSGVLGDSWNIESYVYPLSDELELGREAEVMIDSVSSVSPDFVDEDLYGDDDFDGWYRFLVPGSEFYKELDICLQLYHLSRICSLPPQDLGRITGFRSYINITIDGPLE